MSKLILTRGVPASGKTTIAKAWVAEDPERRARVNRDEYRAMMFNGEGVLTFPQEKAVSAAQQAAVKALLNAGMDVIVDDTNLRAKFVKMWFGISPEIEFMDFPMTINEAYERDNAREAKGERSVGPAVLLSFFERFIGKDGFSLPPRPTSDTTSVKFKPVAPFEPFLPWAVIVDIDGTLAHITEGGRSPYDGHRVGEDILDTTIADIVSEYYALGYRILVTTGRDEKHREVTAKWLKDNYVRHHELIMRPLDDTRNDAIIKDELYEQHIAGKYNVAFVLDDRNRVVDMWRAKGLKTLQVQPGDF